MFTTLNVAVTALVGFSIFWLVDRQRRQNRHLPPGPKGLPFIGNLLQIPKEKECVVFKEMGDACGSDVVTVKVPGYTVIFLNSRQATTDLLDKRSANYSDRPPAVMVTELVGWAGSVVFSNNTPRFRTCRRLLRRGLGQSAVHSFSAFLQRQAPFQLEDLLSHPNNYGTIFRRNAARISMKIAYGYNGVDEDESMYATIAEALRFFDETAILGAWIVDSFPLLKYIPSWFPGAGFKRYAERGHAVTTKTVNKPFDEVKRHVQQGTAGGSFCSMLLQDENCDAETEDCIKWSAAGIFTGQMDTTTAVLSWFLLAMVLHPEVQAKAQAELDRVVGPDRLPQVADRDALPYLTAVMREVFRWQPIITVIPHAATNDDEYRGYFIPAGATVIGNIWAVLHDETVYPQPDKFIPERFLEEGVPDPLPTAFGFGRRQCPGITIAQVHIFLSMASILATLNVSKAKDASGNIIEPVEDGMPGAINFPVPFKVSLEPRSKVAEELVRRSAEHSKTLSDMLEVFKVGV